ncbi:putative Snare associated Golgi protein-domain-containing protein [Seiridium cardinale]|uniref:Golgi apparatus membrane protein TVP38 n=1 Tax=Seiridium cardinale TaxID=138064 RepID=A0ABR2Y0E9_9PEZI
MKDVEMARDDERPGPNRNLEEPTEYKSINWKKIFLTPKYIPWHILLIAIAIITVLITVYHDKVVDVLRPFSEKVRDVPAGWLIPIVILIVISFPPLFGHEIIGLLCGVVYGLWIGFAIVAAGTFLGEVGTWFAFKKVLRKKAEKLERTNLNYAALARVTREGGFWMVFIIRFSIVPSHFSTAVFSTCDVKFWHFAVATFLTLPKQIFIVYLGVLLVAQDNNNRTETIVLVATFAVTIVMGIYIWFKMKKARQFLLQEQAERRTNHSMERLRQTESMSTADSVPKPAGAGSDFEGAGRSNTMWDSRPDTRQDIPLSFTADQPQTVGVAFGSPREKRQPEPSPYDEVEPTSDSLRYNTTNAGPNPYQSAGAGASAPYYTMEQKPYYQRPPRQPEPPYPLPDQPQMGREWV